MRFTKMQGIGNDYIYFNEFEEKISDPFTLSKVVSARRFSIGGDGIVLIGPSEKADFRMRVFNADGSEARMCGNAIRCVGKYVYDRGLTNKTAVTVETLSGVKTLTLTVENGAVALVRVDMGAPVLDPKLIPMNCDAESFINKPLNVDGKEYNGTAVSMGNPHFVVFTKGVDALDLEKLGPRFENHPAFPDRVNTEFVEREEDGLYMRVWERGSGETFACGTGASAVFAAARLLGYCGDKCKIRLRGGVLHFDMSADGHVFMTGPAETVCDGEIDPSQLAKMN